MSLHHAAKSKQMYLYTSNCTTHASDSMGPIVATGDVGIKNKKNYTGKTRQCLDDRLREGTLIGSGAPFWHRSVPTSITISKGGFIF